MKREGSKVLVLNGKELTKMVFVCIVIIMATLSLRPTAEILFNQSYQEMVIDILPAYDIETD